MNSQTYMVLISLKRKTFVFAMQVAFYLFLLLYSLFCSGQKNATWAENILYYPVPCSDAGHASSLYDFPLIDEIFPNTYKLIISPDNKYYILTKNNNSREILWVEKITPLVAKPLKATEIPAEAPINLRNDTLGFLMQYNEVANLFPQKCFEKIAPAAKKPLFHLFTSLEGFKVMKRLKGNHLRAAKIKTDEFVMKIRPCKKTQKPVIKIKERGRKGNEQVRSIFYKHDEILNSQNLIMAFHSSEHSKPEHQILTNKI